MNGPPGCRTCSSAANVVAKSNVSMTGCALTAGSEKMTDPYKQAIYQRNRRIVLEAANYRCYVTGCRNRATTADHITPLILGGSHLVQNLRAACWHHNSQGGAEITNQIKANRRVGRRSRNW